VTGDQQKALVTTGLYEGWVRGDWAKVEEEFYGPDMLVHIPEQAQALDREGWRGMRGMLLEGFPDFGMRVIDIVAEGDRVALRWEMSGTHNGRFAGFPATGKRFLVAEFVIVRIADGKVAEFWLGPDRLEHFRQLGLITDTPPPRALLVALRAVSRLTALVPRRAGAGRRPGISTTHTPPAEYRTTGGPDGPPARRAIEELWSGSEAEAVTDLYAPGVVVHHPDAPAPVEGREAALSLHAERRRAFSGYRVTVEDIVGEAGLVIARCRASGTHSGDLDSMPATGRPFSIEKFAMFRIVDGAVEEVWMLPDRMSLMQQLGLAPEGPPPRPLIALMRLRDRGRS